MPRDDIAKRAAEAINEVHTGASYTGKVTEWTELLVRDAIAEATPSMEDLAGLAELADLRAKLVEAENQNAILRGTERILRGSLEEKQRRQREAEARLEAAHNIVCMGDTEREQAEARITEAERDTARLRAVVNEIIREPCDDATCPNGVFMQRLEDAARGEGAGS